QALDWLRDTVIPRFEAKGREIFRDPWAARNEYIGVILNRWPDNVDKFFSEQATHELSQEEKITALKLMEMQRHAMLMYTSCGWFFDELSGLETVQVVHYAGRALRLAEDCSGESIEADFVQHLAEAKIGRASCRERGCV